MTNYGIELSNKYWHAVQPTKQTTNQSSLPFSISLFFFSK